MKARLMKDGKDRRMEIRVDYKSKESKEIIHWETICIHHHHYGKEIRIFLLEKTLELKFLY